MLGIVFIGFSAIISAAVIFKLSDDILIIKKKLRSIELKLNSNDEDI